MFLGGCVSGHSWHVLALDRQLLRGKTETKKDVSSDSEWNERHDEEFEKRMIRP